MKCDCCSLMRKQNFVMPEVDHVSWFLKESFIKPTLLNIGDFISQYVFQGGHTKFTDHVSLNYSFFYPRAPPYPPPSYASALIQRVEGIDKPEREDDTSPPPNAAVTVFS